jgi:hypothetical protein
VNEKAKEGTVWVCGACGNTSTWRNGYDDMGEQVAWGWDESCSMVAVLCHEASLIKKDGLVLKAEAVDDWDDCAKPMEAP